MLRRRWNLAGSFGDTLGVVEPAGMVTGQALLILLRIELGFTEPKLMLLRAEQGGGGGTMLCVRTVESLLKIELVVELMDAVRLTGAPVVGDALGSDVAMRLKTPRRALTEASTVV